MPGSAVIGICKTQFGLLNCDGTVDATVDPIVYCDVVDVTRVPILTPGVDIKDPSGQPNRDSVSIQIDPVVDYWDMQVTTASWYLPELDELLQQTDTMALIADSSIYGSKAKKRNPSDCLCSCGSSSCQRKVYVISWSLNMCRNGDQAPGGQYKLLVAPGVQFRASASNRVMNASPNGLQYIGRMYENTAFGQGPGTILPTDEAPYDRAWYEFDSDVCPPGGCDCDDCGTAAPAPLSFAQTQQVLDQATADNDDMLTPAAA